MLMPKRALAWSLLLAFILLINFIVYKHASAMLNFTPLGERTRPPEGLSPWQKLKILLTGVRIPRPSNSSTPHEWGLPFEVHSLKLNNRVQMESWYIPCPQARGVVLFFHGYALSKASLLPEARAVYEMGYAPFLVDFRGSGGSSGYSTSLGFYEADEVAKAVEYVRSISSPQPVFLYGRSMGSAAILRAIYTHQSQPDGIILEAVFDRMLTTVQNRFAAMGLPSFPAAQLLIFWGGVQSGYSGFKHNPVEYARRVYCPTLMLHGTDDPRSTLAQGQAVFQNLRGTRRLETFAGVGHEAYLAAHPDRWKQTVSEFLASETSECKNALLHSESYPGGGSGKKGE